MENLYAKVYVYQYSRRFESIPIKYIEDAILSYLSLRIGLIRDITRNELIGLLILYQAIIYRDSNINKIHRIITKDLRICEFTQSIKYLQIENTKYISIIPILKEYYQNKIKRVYELETFFIKDVSEIINNYISI